MTRMTRPDCAVMCNLINTHTHTHTHTHTIILLIVNKTTVYARACVAITYGKSGHQPGLVIGLDLLH